MDIDDGFLSLMQDDGTTRNDVKVPDNDLGKEIQAKFEADEQSYAVTILGAMGGEHAIAIKVLAK